MIDDSIIPVGVLAPDEDELLKYKRELLKEKLVQRGKNSINKAPKRVYSNLDLEQLRYTGDIYGIYDVDTYSYTITSIYKRDVESEEYIGRIFIDEPIILNCARSIIALKNEVFSLKIEIRELKKEPPLRPCFIDPPPPSVFHVGFKQLLELDESEPRYYYNLNKIIGYYQHGNLGFVNEYDTYFQFVKQEKK